MHSKTGRASKVSARITIDGEEVSDERAVALERHVLPLTVQRPRMEPAPFLFRELQNTRWRRWEPPK